MKSKRVSSGNSGHKRASLLTDKQLVPTTQYDLIEVCAGAGGQSLGLHNAGFVHRALVEIEPIACETLRRNGARTGWSGSVVEADLKQWPETMDIPNLSGISLLAGGVPCPPFSAAGKQLGVDDERDLFPRMVELTELLSPRVVMIENVRGLLDSKFDAYRSNLTERFRSLGYEAEWKLLQASDFGVPQLRPRAIMVALREHDYPNFSWPTPTHQTPPTVGEVLIESMKSRGWEGAQDWAAQANQIAPTLVGGSKKHGGPDLGPTRARLQWEKLGVNGKVLANDVPDAGFHGLPSLTVQQTALIQGFPDWWEIAGKKTASYRQVGNAFPPPVAAAVGRQIMTALTQSDNAEDTAA